MVTKAQRKTMIAGGLVVLLATSSMAGAAIWFGKQNPDDGTVEADSFETNHLVAKYLMEFEAKPVGEDVVVALDDYDMTLTLRPGDYNGIGEVIKDDEKDSPTCLTESSCYRGFSEVQLVSRPGTINGKTHELIRWVNWYHYPTIAGGGTSTVDFQAKVPGEYAEYEFILTTGVITWSQGYFWSNTKYEVADPIREFVKVEKA